MVKLLNFQRVAHSLSPINILALLFIAVVLNQTCANHLQASDSNPNNNNNNNNSSSDFYQFLHSNHSLNPNNNNNNTVHYHHHNNNNNNHTHHYYSTLNSDRTISNVPSEPSKTSENHQGSFIFPTVSNIQQQQPHHQKVSVSVQTQTQNVDPYLSSEFDSGNSRPSSPLSLPAQAHSASSSNDQLIMTKSSPSRSERQKVVVTDEQEETATTTTFMNNNNNNLAPSVVSMSAPLSLSPGFVYGINTDLHLENKTATVRGIRVEESRKGVSYENKGVSVILADSVGVLRLFGDRFTKHTIMRFVTEMLPRGMDCDDLTSTRSFPLYKSDLTSHSALANIQLPPLDVGEEVFYICVRENNTDMPWVHQGTEQWIQLKSFETILPLWAHITILVVLLFLSGLFSGLNLGLMALDRTEIQIIANTGSEKERRDAKSIQPLRDNGNYLLCSLLLGNVLVNSTLTILLDDLTTGLVAVIASTLGIVIFGEIVPQAFCSRHGLAVGANTIWLTKFLCAITFPISYPVSVILDKVLGEEIGNVYNRDRLKELIRVTHQYNDLEKDEVNIIAGALEMKQKTVKDVMTPIDKIFMLPIDTVLDFDCLTEIQNSGFSRIPVYDGKRTNVISLLYTKDLIFVDPADNMPLKIICEFYNNPCNFVFETTTLDVLFREFKLGIRGHMAFCQKIHSGCKDEDPFYEIVGLITMEDVIEALIQAEINDETDIGISRRKLSKANDSELPILRWKSEGIHVSRQLALAAYQFISTSVEQFNERIISKTILQRLLNQNLFFKIKVKHRDCVKTDPAHVIYERGKPADYFVLILEGRVQVEMGRENLVFESGPFSFFGTQSLNQNVGIGEAPSTPNEHRKSVNYNAANLESLLYSTFIPDYTVRAVTDVTFVRISRSIYMAAKQATILQMHGDSNAQNRVGENFEEQIDKMMNFDKGKSKEDMSNDNLNYFRRINSFRLANLGNKRGSEIFSEFLLRPSLLISDYDKERRASFLFPSLRRESRIDSPTLTVSRPDSPHSNPENDNPNSNAKL